MFVAQTPARVHAELQALRHQAAELSLPDIPFGEEDGSSTEPTNTVHTSPPKAQARPVPRSPDENSPAAHLAPSSDVGTAKTIRAAKSKSPSPSPSLRATPSGRGKRPLGTRQASPQPVASSPGEARAHVEPRKKSQSPAVVPELPPPLALQHGEEEDDSDDSDSSNRSTGRGWKGARSAGARPPALVASSSTSSSSDDSGSLPSPPGTEERGGPVVLSTSRVEAPPTTSSEDDEEDSSHLETPADLPPASSPLARLPFRRPSSRAHQHTPNRPSNLHEVMNASWSASDSGSAQSSPARGHLSAPTSPAAALLSNLRSDSSTSSEPMSPLPDVATPKAVRANPMAQYVLTTLSKPTRLNTVPRSRLVKAQTPFRRAAETQSEEETSSYASDDTSGSSTNISFHERRYNTSMPIRGVEGGEVDGKLDSATVIKHLYAVNAGLNEEAVKQADRVKECEAELEVQAEQQKAIEAELAVAQRACEELNEERAGWEECLAKEQQKHARAIDKLAADLHHYYGSAAASLDDGQKRSVDLQTALQEKNVTIDMMKKERQALMVQVEQLQERLEEHGHHLEDRSEAPDADEARRTAEAEIVRLKAELQRLTARRLEDQGAYEKRINELKDEAATKDQTLHEAEPALRHWQSEWEAAQALLQNRDDQLAEAQLTIEKLRQDLQRNQEAQEDDFQAAFDEAILPWQDESERLRAERQHLQDTVDALRQDLQDERERQLQTGEAGDEQQRLIDECADLRDVLLEREGKISDLQIQVDQGARHYSALERSANRLREQYEGAEAAAKLAELQEENDALRFRLKRAEIVTGNSPGTPASFVARAVRAMSTPPGVSRFMRSLSQPPIADESLAAGHEEIRRLQAEIVELRAELQRANQRADRKITGLESALAQKEQELAEGRQDLQAAEEHIAELQQNMSQMEGSGRASVGEHMVRQQLAGLKDEKKRIEAALQRARFELAQHKYRAEASANETQLHAQEKTLLADQVQSLRQQLANAQAVATDKETALSKLHAVNRRCLELQDELAEAKQKLQAGQTAQAKLAQELAELRKSYSAVRLDADAIGKDCASLVRRLNKGGEVSRAEAKTLLAYITYLKHRCTREETFRVDLAHQKVFLHNKVTDGQNSLEATRRTLAKFGLDYPEETLQNTRPTFKSAALAIRFICRLQSLSTEWRQTEQTKHDIRASWEKSRGRTWQA